MKKFCKQQSFLNHVSRKYVMLTIFTLFFLFIFSISLINIVKAKSVKEYDKVYVSIEIKQGDTLSSYAQKYAVSPSKYNDYIDEVRYINNLKDDTLYAGCYILIPLYYE